MSSYLKLGTSVAFTRVFTFYQLVFYVCFSYKGTCCVVVMCMFVFMV